MAAVIKPFWVALIEKSSATRGKAMPPMKTIKPSKNLPAVAKAHTSHCMVDKGALARVEPSSQLGISSM